MSVEGDVAAFLAARLDEDETAAKAAWGIEWSWGDLAQPFRERSSIAHTVHIARHDPARVLREVEAKRAIVKRCVLVLESFGHPGPRQTFRHLSRREHSHALQTLALLAAVYSDHPDYQAGWKP